MNPEKIKHLEFLQAIIMRMNTNSFQIKTMCVMLVSAILGFAFTLKNMLLLFVPCMPILYFGLLMLIIFGKNANFAECTKL